MENTQGKEHDCSMDITNTTGSKQANKTARFIVMWHSPVSAGSITRCHFSTKAAAKRTADYMNAQGNVWAIWGAI
jgi:hypothetical protein